MSVPDIRNDIMTKKNTTPDVPSQVRSWRKHQDLAMFAVGMKWDGKPLIAKFGKGSQNIFLHTHRYTCYDFERGAGG